MRNRIRTLFHLRSGIPGARDGKRHVQHIMRILRSMPPAWRWYSPGCCASLSALRPTTFFHRPVTSQSQGPGGTLYYRDLEFSKAYLIRLTTDKALDKGILCIVGYLLKTLHASPQAGEQCPLLLFVAQWPKGKGRLSW